MHTNIPVSRNRHFSSRESENAASRAKEKHDYLVMEVKEAWSHYRHIEETRTKYLSFFSTVILAASGFLVTLMKDMPKFDEVEFIASVSAFVFILFFFSYAIWANLIRMGAVLASYERIMNTSRAHVHGDTSDWTQLWNVRAGFPPVVSSGWFEVQTAANRMVLGVCVSLACAEIYMAWRLFCHSQQQLAAALVSAGATAMVLTLTPALYRLTISRTKK